MKVRHRPASIQALAARLAEANAGGPVAVTRTDRPSTSGDHRTPYNQRNTKPGNWQGDNVLEVIFQIVSITGYGIHNPHPTYGEKPFGMVFQNPYLYPDVLPDGYFPTGWLKFRFILLKENKNNRNKLPPTDTGDYEGQSKIIPYPAPYVTYRGKIVWAKDKDPKDPEKGSYRVVELLDYRIQTATELSRTMFVFILEVELAIKREKIALLEVVCKSFISSTTDTYDCYDITRLASSILPDDQAIYKLYHSRSPHSIGKELQAVMLWFDVNSTNVNVYDRATVDPLVDIYYHVLKFPMETYFEKERVDYSKAAGVPMVTISNQFPLISGSVRKDSFLNFLRVTKEHSLVGMYDRILKAKEAINEIKIQLGGNTVFYNFHSQEAFRALNDLLNLSLVVQCKRELETYAMTYYKLSEYDKWTALIVRGLTDLINTNQKFVAHLESIGPNAVIAVPCVGPDQDIPTNFDVDIVDITPLDISELNPEQTRAYNMVIVQKKPLVCVTGPPGTGKSKLIQKLFQFYQQNRLEHMFFATTFVNAAIDRLNTCGIPGQGIWATYYAWKTKSKATLAMLFSIQLLVIEEFSNCSEETTSMLMEFINDACPNLLQIVFIFDDQQIRPIDPGNPAINLLHVLKPLGTSEVFHRNHRVLDHPECAVLVDNGTRYRNLDSFKGEQFEFKTTDVRSAREIGKWGCFHITQGDYFDNLQAIYGPASLLMVVISFQAISFKNVIVQNMNHCIDNALKPRIAEWVKTYFPEAELSRINGTNVPFVALNYQTRSSYYPGQRIIFTKVQATAKTMQNVTMYELQPANNEGLVEMTPTVWSKLVLSTVNNGEFGIIKAIYRYYPAKKLLVDYRCVRAAAPDHGLYEHVFEVWNPVFNRTTGRPCTEDDWIHCFSKPCWRLNNPKPENVDSPAVTKLVLIRDKEGGVPLYSVFPGWSVTVDKYQGAQSKTVVLNFHSGDGLNFSKEHGLVAITRMEDRLIVMGDKEELYRMSSSPNMDRLVDLEWRLQSIVK